jgi:outer membrane receptor protein involved in Fe transport
VQWHEKFRSILGLRGDFHRFEVKADRPENSGRRRDHIFSPKLALVFGPWARTEYYANAGYGFHSNDARGVTLRVNPDPRDPGFLGAAQPVSPLVRARGYEIGLRSAVVPTLHTALALWRLDLDSELLFVGDAGTTEASRPSRRTGIEWSAAWTPLPWLTLDADVALSRARFRDDDSPGDRIPGAIERTASLGVSVDGLAHWSGSLRLRHCGPRPLTEDNAVRSPSSTLVNLRLGYRFDRNLRLTLDVLNLFDRKVSDIDYFYESRLPGEAAPVADLHTHPAEPRSVRLALRASF